MSQVPPLFNKHILMLSDLLATDGWVVITGRIQGNKNSSSSFSIYLVLHYAYSSIYDPLRRAFVTLSGIPFGQGRGIYRNTLKLIYKQMITLYLVADCQRETLK